MTLRRPLGLWLGPSPNGMLYGVRTHPCRRGPARALSGPGAALLAPRWQLR